MSVCLSLHVAVESTEKRVSGKGKKATGKNVYFKMLMLVII